MTLTNLATINHLERFLDGSEACHYELPGNKDERYRWIQKTLVQFRYTTLGKRDKGAVIKKILRARPSDEPGWGILKTPET